MIEYTHQTLFQLLFTYIINEPNNLNSKKLPHQLTFHERQINLKQNQNVGDHNSQDNHRSQFRIYTAAECTRKSSSRINRIGKYETLLDSNIVERNVTIHFIFLWN